MLNLTSERAAHVTERLTNDLITWLTTVRPDGRPHTVPVWFLWDGATILIFRATKVKVHELKQNPNVTLALDPSNIGNDIVVIEGTAELVDDVDITTTLPAFARKYGALLKDMGWTAESMAPNYPHAVRVTPVKILGFS
ncbi:MAG TPA: pyridoxamine 5'-phosphate oxidase family protein [Ktedonobacteraceae bacterium]|nr:pyridoxamine 5'-phosphate oxidase family protein [Ktedonobacteraceae bacterium]